MSKVCEICGKKKTSGNKVSHSNRKTRRTFSPNLQTVNLGGKKIKVWGQTQTAQYAGWLMDVGRVEVAE